MVYNDYRRHFDLFRTDSGYGKACELLEFPNSEGFERYRRRIETFLKEIHSRRNSLLTMADVCCGEYAWLARHFSDYGSVIYVLDILDTATEKARKLSKKVVPIVGDASRTLMKLEDLDALYCGFNIYENFLPGISHCVSLGGGIFLMRPKRSDDLILRSITKGYGIKDRGNEIRAITSGLIDAFNFKYYEEDYRWEFERPVIDEILAALSVVGLGTTQRDLLSENMYRKARAFLEDRYDSQKDMLSLTQTLSIWEGVKRQK